MKTIKLSELLNVGPAFQGDLMLSADKLPEGVKELKTNVVAHSETGHHHIAEHAQVFGGLDPMVMFLKPTDKPYVDIVHKRSFDTHETIRVLFDIEGYVPKVSRQEEYTPSGWRRIED